ncbi:sarcosine oxidase subunit gamma [Pseudaestuariivita atlantica]|uniref:Sarcosine oxidase subunit gamma n=1 Tax=Pseudaestuariivita atlantica TaxID=1317121 RepID=A0A0L1JUC2_9RHOB|nr:sarcosine oxidase subunit gamma family protein [Pseudaestuariivita atlantica]KNG95355.1 sarcosine oxidase subunit gamma [Pseudaestuariivita atlantica]
MSEAVTALGGASFNGLVAVRERPLTGMITIRADLSDKAVAGAVGSVTGLDMPGTGRIVEGEGCAIAWMSPDEALVFCDYAEAWDKVAVLQGALAECHALVANVSDARAVFELDGAAARDVLAKLTPADLRDGAFAPGTMRRTRLAQVAAAVWPTEAGTIRIVCFRSVADYVMQLLSVAADPDAPVGWHG